MTTIDRVEDRIWREVQMMTAAGWTLYQRHPYGADFTHSAEGISAGVHVLLLVLTAGLWLPFLIIMEVVSSFQVEFYRMTMRPEGPRYEKINRPKR